MNALDVLTSADALFTMDPAAVSVVYDLRGGGRDDLHFAFAAVYRVADVPLPHDHRSVGSAALLGCYPSHASATSALFRWRRYLAGDGAW